MHLLVESKVPFLLLLSFFSLPESGFANPVCPLCKSARNPLQVGSNALFGFFIAMYSPFEIHCGFIVNRASVVLELLFQELFQLVSAFSPLKVLLMGHRVQQSTWR